MKPVKFKAIRRKDHELMRCETHVSQIPLSQDDPRQHRARYHQGAKAVELGTHNESRRGTRQAQRVLPREGVNGLG